MYLRALSRKAAARPLLGLGLRPVSIGIRHMSTPSNQDPKSKAVAILNSLPGNSALTKTGILATSAAAAVYAVSNELYILNAETILLGTFTGVCYLIVKFLAPAYSDFAEKRIKHVSDILNSSRTKHVEAVKTRIESVSELSNVAQTTKTLFDVSKETLELEAKVFELKQKQDVIKEATAVLDSWVRYEASVRQMQQQQVADSVIGKVQSEVANPKFQERVLQQSVAEVEKLFANLK
ncbi:HDR069Wp [Eremothecium sinecaudum]|uniref:ATP synthase subunit 4 n=1 Tax=Eremothecium sinecaudum TaxID=45286 RepID=A0A0X8HST8_9SACH|nr:HDR069Wp [Eremothecium sinecaudum]AMD20811.1 HDR069Wp [Eremothecium sinecaudum]